MQWSSYCSKNHLYMLFSSSILGEFSQLPWFTYLYMTTWMDQFMDGLLNKLRGWNPFLSRNGECEAGRHKPLPQLFVAPEANSSLRATGLYLAVHNKLARLTAIRSGKTAFYGVVCQLQRYAVLLLLARIFIRLLLDYFLSNALPQACLYWELWTNSVSPSNRNMSICGLHSLTPL